MSVVTPFDSSASKRSITYFRIITANMGRPITKKGLKKKADKLWSQIIRAKGKCEVCGETRYLNPHHVIGKRNHAVRFDLRNGACLCSGCHTFRVKSAHNDPQWFMEWFQSRRPDDAIAISRTKNYITKRTIQDYKELVEELKEANEKEM